MGRVLSCSPSAAADVYLLPVCFSYIEALL